MHLPYGHPTYKYVDISALEKVQRTATRYALNNYSWRSSVTAMLNSLNWPTLESCRVYSKLVMFYKVIKSHIEVPSLSLNPIFTSTRGHSQRFRPPYASLNTYLFSFLPSTIKLWSNLPENIVNQPTLSDFKKSLYCLYYN